MILSFKYTKHKDTPQDELETICSIKDENWNYGLQNQLDWIKNNINDEDIHVIVEYNSRLIAYLNLVVRQITIDKDNFEVFGIGNVCVSKSKHKSGLGTQLMNYTKEYLKTESKIGILLCKDSLIKFYEKNGWRLIDTNKLGPSLKGAKVSVMTFNFNRDYESIELKGNLF
ncbi:hypothetical protein BTO05_08580 [Winogradskyella sp. PC-19]|uniref:GNAT family N-acetyltransferase n=1 Tax=Winogradskyella sp. PC-19 TaxID=754417 RepID=UPI000B3C8E3B|nr:GNAT family N-acetyltransferase [Winogradskyella sp. PC-19]ARV09694.1 hypothetical protein BTO05_08580 [Winogradskyella sp. PC-19]